MLLKRINSLISLPTSFSYLSP